MLSSLDSTRGLAESWGTVGHGSGGEALSPQGWGAEPLRSLQASMGEPREEGHSRSGGHHWEELEEELSAAEEQRTRVAERREAAALTHTNPA